MEECNFITRPGDNYVGYVNGVGSNRGYLLFRQYIVNMDNSLPIPYFQLDVDERVKYSRYGCLIDDDESEIILNGSLIIANSYLDVYFAD
jgi:hypothetical protein